MLTNEPNVAVSPTPQRRRLERVLSMEWLGQTFASICWMGSVFVYGISSNGDWLQLFAASFWLVANVASISTAKAD
ncbi:hypothetical protein [Crateriforma conspicua]|uniref:Uncharacterized protein n=1 Tax=Crateriforma conspicua TaxID=2527996 RepID=A0A5C5YBS2_9PLAN|nr:hypothetical protein [Crateriforma conspicua]TWT71785.1 hypothetical protein Pan14r_41010 [Crateriforma conspicua]